jgi:hypothetical protein
MTGIGFIINLLNKVPNPDEPVGAKRKSRLIGELKIEYLWMSLAPRVAPSFLKWIVRPRGSRQEEFLSEP